MELDKLFPTGGTDVEDSADRHSFVVEYELQGKRFVDETLTRLLSMKGQDLSGKSRGELESLHIDLSYYRMALLFAKKELFRKLNNKCSAFQLWLSPVRQKILKGLYEQRTVAKTTSGVKMQDVTTREVDDELITQHGIIYYEYENEIKTLESDMKFFAELIDEIHSRRIQLQGIVKYMQESR